MKSLRQYLPFKALLIGIPMLFLGPSLQAEEKSYSPEAELSAEKQIGPELPITPVLIEDLKKLNINGEIHAAWLMLASKKDGYAVSAADIVGKATTVGKCVVEENWKVVVGEETRKTLLPLYAQYYQKSYIDFLEKNQRYPTSLEIEYLYRNADDAFELPQAVSVDLLFNTIPTDWDRRVFFDRLSSFIGVGRLVNDKRWYHYTHMHPARFVDDYIVAKDLNLEDAKEIYRRTSAGVAKCMLGIFKPRFEDGGSKVD